MNLFQTEKWFNFAGKPSLDFYCIAGQAGGYNTPTKDDTFTSIAGRYGDLYTENGRWDNIVVTYSCFIAGDRFFKQYQNLMAWLMSNGGYQVLRDSAHPGFYRLAVFQGGTTPEVTRHGASFDISFSCDPRRFYDGGNIEQPAEATIYNPTLFTAKPLLYLSTITKGTTLKVNDTVLTFNEARTAEQSRIVIDSERMNIYTEDGLNYNTKVAVNENSSEPFPLLHAGSNTLTISDGNTATIKTNIWTI